MQPTVKLYESDAYLTTFEALVCSCVPQEGAWGVVLDRTAFYPEGGGQPADTGTLGAATVTAVHRAEATGIITHLCTAPLPAGQRVKGCIDWARRLDLMQQHSGEHILSGTLHRLYGAENVGFHIGAPAVRMDMSLPLDAAQLRRAEAEANAAVRADLPLRCWYPAPAELAATVYRSKKELTGAVRLVDAGGADLCACCGTHVASTGQVGLIKILSAQSYKGGVRLAVACGQRAYEAIATAWADAETAGRQLSAAPGALAPALQHFLDAEVLAKQRLAALQNALAERCAAAATPAQPAVLQLDGVDGDGARRVAQAVCGKTGAPCTVFYPGKTADVLNYALAGPADIRPLAKALNTQCAGRGGGKPNFCQGSLPAAQLAAARPLLLQAQV